MHADVDVHVDVVAVDDDDDDEHDEDDNDNDYEDDGGDDDDDGGDDDVDDGSMHSPNSLRRQGDRQQVPDSVTDAHECQQCMQACACMSCGYTA